MKFISTERVERLIKRNGTSKTLQKYWRYRIAPGFTVADYIKIGEFYGIYSKESQ